jgi:hypothetical protein
VTGTGLDAEIQAALATQLAAGTVSTGSILDDNNDMMLANRQRNLLQDRECPRVWGLGFTACCALVLVYCLPCICLRYVVLSYPAFNVGS